MAYFKARRRDFGGKTFMGAGLRFLLCLLSWLGIIPRGSSLRNHLPPILLQSPFLFLFLIPLLLALGVHNSGQFSSFSAGICSFLNWVSLVLNKFRALWVKI